MSDPTPIIAPMAASVISIDVEPGAAITRGQQIAVLEAMKMQHEIAADVAGTVAEVVASANAQIAADELILRIEPAG